MYCSALITGQYRECLGWVPVPGLQMYSRSVVGRWCRGVVVQLVLGIVGEGKGHGGAEWLGKVGGVWVRA